jgi:hypothetical protein
MQFRDDQLYACGEEGGGVAGLVRWDPDRNTIAWFQPGGRERAFDVAGVLEDSQERFAFVDRVGRKFVLFVLTPDHYNDHIRRPGTPSYPTPEALMGAYQRSLG